MKTDYTDILLYGFGAFYIAFMVFMYIQTIKINIEDGKKWYEDFWNNITFSFVASGYVSIPLFFVTYMILTMIFCC